MRDGLPPEVGPRARVLLLGSFPSERSLELQQYYANPRNQMWALLGATFDFDAAVGYPERLAAAQHHGIALWDVVATCRRAGSLDAKIDRRSVVANDVAALLAEHRSIELIVVNGAAAMQLFERHIHVDVPAVRVPSSSPAATMPFADKLAQWRAVI